VCPSAWLGLLVVQEESLVRTGVSGLRYAMQTVLTASPMELMQRRTAWRGVELSRCKSQWQGCLLLIAGPKGDRGAKKRRNHPPRAGRRGREPTCNLLHTAED